MNLTSLLYVALISFFSSNLLAQSSFTEISIASFSTTNLIEADSESEFYKTANFSVSQIKDLLKKKITYPSTMRAYNIEGNSMVSFRLSKKGEIENIVIEESLGNPFDYEIKRVLSSINNITPIKANGKVISQKIILPIQFEL